MLLHSRRFYEAENKYHTIRHARRTPRRRSRRLDDDDEGRSIFSLFDTIIIIDVFIRLPLSPF